MVDSAGQPAKNRYQRPHQPPLVRTRVMEATEPSDLSTTRLSLGLRKSNRPVSEPARWSKEPSPIRPVFQLSSMNCGDRSLLDRLWSM